MKNFSKKTPPTCVVGLPLPAHEFIFAEERPFAACHAATLIQLADSGFLVAWFGGTHEANADTAIWCAVRSKSGWGEPRQIMKVNGTAHWNPVLYRDESGVIHLWFKVGVTVAAWRTWYAVSHDEGLTWSQPEPHYHASRVPLGPVKNKPIRLHDGTLLAGFSDEPPGARPKTRDWLTYTARSSDNGASWHAITEIPCDRPEVDRGDSGMIQPALWESTPGRVHALMRTTYGTIYRSDSEDGGLTWCPAYDTGLPHNNSGLDLVRTVDGTLVLACNPVAVKSLRTPLRLLLSRDNGASWPLGLDIERGEGEYSYPAVIATPCGIAVAHTWRRQRIAFWHGTLDHLTTSF